jgi:hypothetical protein
LTGPVAKRCLTGGWIGGGAGWRWRRGCSSLGNGFRGGGGRIRWGPGRGCSVCLGITGLVIIIPRLITLSCGSTLSFFQGYVVALDSVAVVYEFPLIPALPLAPPPAVPQNSYSSQSSANPAVWASVPAVLTAAVIPAVSSDS